MVGRWIQLIQNKLTKESFQLKLFSITKILHLLFWTKFVLKTQHKDTALTLMLEGICTQLALARNVHTRKD